MSPGPAFSICYISLHLVDFHISLLLAKLLVSSFKYIKLETLNDRGTVWCYKLVQRMSVCCQSCKSWGFGAFCILCKTLTGIQYFANDKKWWRNVREIRPWSRFERFNSFSVHVLKLELEDVFMKYHVVFFYWTKKNVCKNFYGIKIVKNAGHWVQQEQPKKVCELLINFFNSIDEIN